MNSLDATLATDHAPVFRLRAVVGFLAFVACFSLTSPRVALAQAAGMLRPNRIAPDSRELTVPTTLAGFRLGEATGPAQARLGTSITADTLGTGPSPVVSLTNRATGIVLFVSRDGGVGVIMVSEREAGDLDGIRVGDTRSTVVAKWGPPAAGGANAGLWLAGTALVSVAFDATGRVTRLGMGTAFDGAGQ
jgi:hypothetical protein